MNENLIFEVNADDRPLIEDLLAKHPDEIETLEARNIAGTAVLLLMLKYGPGAIALGRALYSLFKKENKPVTVVLPGGERIENLTDEQLKKLLEKQES